jgi:hypothetical protein
MSLFPSSITKFLPKPKNPKGTALGSVIGSFIPGIGSDLGGQIGNVIGDILPSSGGAAREGGGRPDSLPAPEVLTQQNQIPDMRPVYMTGSGTDNIQRDMTFRRSPMIQQANVVTGLFGQAARTLTRPGVGGFIGGTALGSIVEFFIDEFGNEKKLVITRKMQRDIRELFKMSGGDFATTAFLYEEATGRRLTERQVIKIYTKKFSNQGPYVTKAAVRKMKRTYMKLDTLCDLKDKMCPPKRRAPARRRSTASQTITQVK